MDRPPRLRDDAFRLGLGCFTARSSEFTLTQEPAFPLAPLRARPTDIPRSANGVGRALVVEDDEILRDLLAQLLQRRGLRAITAPDGRRALKLFEAGLEIDLAVIDVKLSGMSGIETLRRIRETHPLLPVIVVSGCDDVATVTEAGRLGVVDYVNKPFEPRELDLAIDLALAEAAKQQLAHPVPSALPKPELWQGAAMAEVRHLIEQIASTDASVMIQGETGVGKDIVARAIHQVSTRAAKPFVKVHCASLPNQLLESELFGYEKGAFTDAWAQKKGKFELAHGGTIFLDEIFEIGMETQPKLLQVLQDREVHRIGSNEPIPIDTRIVCATHRPLEQMVREKRFRADLFYRLNVVQIQVPPLRERREEIPGLFDAFVRHYAAKYRRPMPAISPRVRQFLKCWRFPGNVRELENLARRIVVLGPCALPLMERRPLDWRVADELAETAGAVPLLEVRRRVAREVERTVIECALAETGWNRREASRRLGLSYSTMLQKIKECGLGTDEDVVATD